MTSPTYTPGRYYEYDEPPRRRTVWPWLLAVVLVAGALVGGWFAYEELQDQLSATKPVAVPDVKGVPEELAVSNIREAGLKELVQREANSEGVKEGVVASQDPQPGERIEKGNFVTIIVSTGPPKTHVPDVVGQSRDEAVSQLVNAGLKANVVAVNSLQDVNTVLATAPKAGTELIEGATVRVNVSKGPRPDHGAERDRVRVRERRVDAPGRRIRGRARGGRGSRRRGNGPRADPGRRHAAAQELGDHPSGVLRPEDLPGSGRDEPHRGGRARATRAFGLRGSRSSRRSSTTSSTTARCCRRIPRAAATPRRA